VTPTPVTGFAAALALPLDLEGVEKVQWRAMTTLSTLRGLLLLM